MIETSSSVPVTNTEAIDNDVHARALQSSSAASSGSSGSGDLKPGSETARGAGQQPLQTDVAVESEQGPSELSAPSERIERQALATMASPAVSHVEPKSSRQKGERTVDAGEGIEPALSVPKQDPPASTDRPNDDQYGSKRSAKPIPKACFESHIFVSIADKGDAELVGPAKLSCRETICTFHRVL